VILCIPVADIADIAAAAEPGTAEPVAGIAAVGTVVVLHKTPPVLAGH